MVLKSPNERLSSVGGSEKAILELDPSGWAALVGGVPVSGCQGALSGDADHEAGCLPRRSPSVVWGCPALVPHVSGAGSIYSGEHSRERGVAYRKR